MKNIKKTKCFGLFLIIMVLNNCSPSIEKHSLENVPRIEIDLKDKEKKEVHFVSDVIDTFYIVPLQTDSTSIFAEVSKLLIFSDTIFIWDKILNSILIFGIKGNYINRIDGVGKGIGEYYRIRDFTVNYKKGEIILYDDIHLKYLLYNFHGKFIKEFKAKPYFNNIAYLGNDLIFKYNNFNQHKTRDRYNCWITNLNDSVYLKSFPYTKNVSKRSSFDKKCVSINNQNVLYSPLYDNIVYTVSDSIFPKYEIDFGIYNPDFNHEISGSNSFKPNMVTTFQEFFENDSFLNFNYVFLNNNYQMQLTCVLYNKKSNKVIFPWENVIIDIPFFALGKRTIAIYDDYFVSSSYANEIINYNIGITNGMVSVGPSIEIWNENLTKYDSQVSILNNLEKTDNPVLFFYKYKSNETKLD